MLLQTTDPQGKLNTICNAVIKVQKIIKWYQKANHKNHVITDSEVAGYWTTGRQNVNSHYVTKRGKNIMHIFPLSSILHIKTADNVVDCGTCIFRSSNKKKYSYRSNPMVLFTKVPSLMFNDPHSIHIPKNTNLLLNRL